MEVSHEFSQCDDAFHRHGIVNGCPDTPDTAMTFETHKIAFGCFRYELALQLVCGESERHIHQRTTRIDGMAPVKAIAPDDFLIKTRRLLLIQFVNLCQSAHVLEQPLGDEIYEINRKGWRRVEHRVIFEMLAVIQISWQ